MKASLTAALVTITAGLTASLALAHDYLFTPIMCATSGCDIVRASAFSHPLGVPMPVVGVVFFVAMFVMMQIDRPRLRRGAAIAGGVAGIGFLAIQGLVIGAWCKLCVIVDSAAIVLAVSVLAGARLRRFRLPAALATAAIAGGALLLLARGEASEPVVSVQPRSAIVKIVEMVDFECPFCRAMNERVEAAIARASGPVEVIRKMVPLSIHAHAMPAALAWCCADAQGKGKAMARALFAAKPSTLTEEGCAKIAEQVGCDMALYRAHLPDAKERVVADMREAKADGVRGLPTLFIGNERVVGLTMTTDELVAAIERARG